MEVLGKSRSELKIRSRFSGGKTASAKVLPFLLALSVSPAAAQIFWQPPSYPVHKLSDQDEVGVPMPGARPEERRASDAWQMRAALNVMAMQCQFDPTLHATAYYRDILLNHRVELAKAYATMNGYFIRTTGSQRAGMAAMDRYDTKNYSNFSTVNAQYDFCAATSRLAGEATRIKVGTFTQFAMDNLTLVYASLQRQGEQQYNQMRTRVATPSLDRKCWKGNRYNEKCGYSE